MANKEKDQAITILPTYISTAAQSSNFTTNAYPIQQQSKYALQVNITGASGLNVAIAVQETLDGVNYSPIPGSSVSFTANGSYIWQVSVSASIFTQLAFTFTSGSALFQVYAFAKF